MSLPRKPLDNITEADIAAMIESGVREGQTIEFKRETYQRNDEGKREFLKDISSLANTAGGHLIIGICCTDGVASRVNPLEGLEVDKEILWLDSLVQSCIEPRIPGLRIVAVPFGDGVVLVARVPKSWFLPHRVAFKSQRFYARNSAGVYEPDVGELRSLFTLASASAERASQFCDRRLEAIQNNSTPVPVSGNEDRFILHMWPLGAFSGLSQTVDLDQAYQLQNEFRPINSTGYSARVNFDGLLVYEGGDRSSSYTQLFRNGVVEAVRSGLVVRQEQARWLPAGRFEKWLLSSASAYLNGLRQLAVAPPISARVTLTKIRGSIVHLGDYRYDSSFAEQSYDRLDFPTVLIEEYGEPADHMRALKPVCDAIWNAGGRFASANFDADGVWKEP